MWAYERRVQQKTLDIFSSALHIKPSTAIFIVPVIILAAVGLGFLLGRIATIGYLIGIGAAIIMLFILYLFIMLIACINIDKENRKAIESLREAREHQRGLWKGQ